MFATQPKLLYRLDFDELSPGPRMLWQRLWCRYERLYKKRYQKRKSAVTDDVCCKKRRVLCY